MIKRLYLANGQLAQPLAGTSDDIALDTATITYILSVLNVGDWAYLTITWMDKLEVVRVHLDYSGLNVDRGIGTRQHGFPMGASVRYKLTQSEIEDKVSAPTLNIVASGYGVMSAVEFNGQWILGYTPLQIQAVGGIQTYYTDDGNLVIVDAVGAFGCCGGAGGAGAPAIPGPYFYLTSQLYPFNVVESGINTAPQGRGRDGKPFGPPFNFMLLNEFFTVHDSLKSMVSTYDMSMIGGSHSYTDLEALKTSVSLHDAIMFGGTEAYTQTEALQGSAYPLSALLYGGAVTYSDASSAVKTSVLVHDMTVA